MTAILAGDVDADVRAVYREHLATCPTCAARWRELSDTARAVEAGAQEAMVIGRDLTAGRVEEESRSRRATTRRARRIRAVVRWSFAGALVAAVALGLLARGPDVTRIMAVVEAASAQRRTHMVEQQWDENGDLLVRTESWFAPNGDAWLETRDMRAGTRTRQLIRSGSKIQWEFSDNREYELLWNPSAAREFQEMMEAASSYSVAGVRATGVLMWLGLMSKSGIDFKVSQRDGEFKGRKVRIVSTNRMSGWDLHGSPGDARLEWFLTPDGSRLLGCRIKGHCDDGTAMTILQWPIEYDVAPPEGLFDLEIPEDARVQFDGVDIQPVWETMSEAEKQKVKDAVEGFRQALHAGDFEQFSRWFDFEAALDYGVTSRPSVQDMRGMWQSSVERQADRWDEMRIDVDYAYLATVPHRNLRQFYGIEPVKDVAPALMVLARMYLKDEKGENHLACPMMMKKTADGYKVILARRDYDFTW